MKKVNIKVKFSQLEAIIEALRHERPEMKTDTIGNKMLNELFVAAFSKLCKKEIDKATNHGFKPFKMEFTYPEAVVLYMELEKVESESEYRKNVCHLIKNEIHSQLV